MNRLRPEHYQANKKAPYKTEPILEDVSDGMEECEKVANKFSIESLGEIPCPIPSEAE